MRRTGPVKAASRAESLKYRPRTTALRIVQHGVVYTGGQSKIAEHGGAGFQDRNVPVLVDIPGLRHAEQIGGGPARPAACLRGRLPFQADAEVTAEIGQAMRAGLDRAGRAVTGHLDLVTCPP